jgi:hypothetical protein
MVKRVGYLHPQLYTFKTQSASHRASTQRHQLPSTYPAGCCLAHKVAAQLTGEVVAIPLQQMVAIALVVSSHAKHHGLDGCGGELCSAHTDALTELG